MRSGLLLLMVAATIAAGCRTVSYQTADSAAVEPAVFSYSETALSEALAAFLQGRLIEEEFAQGSAKALPFYLRSLKLAPGSHTVYSRVIVEAMLRGDLQKAIQAMEASYKATPEDATRQIDLGAMYQLAARQEEAAALFEKALSRKPGHTALYIALADIYFSLEQNEKALSIMADGFPLADAPDDLKAHLYQQVRRFVARDATHSAITILKLLSDWNEGERAEIAYMIGELHMAEAQTDEARKAFYRAIAEPDASAAAFFRLGTLLVEQEDTNEAIRILHSGSEKFPHLVSFPFALGGLYMEEERYEDALLAYESAVRIARSDDAKENRAQKPPKADPNLLIALAAAQERLIRYEDAAATLQQVLAKDAENHIAMNFLAYMWAELNKNLSEAYALSRRSLEQAPDNGAYLDTLGWIYYRKQNLAQALLYLQRAREQLGDDPEIILHFGDVYAAKGDMQRAEEYWKKSVLADATPNNRAWQQLQTIEIDPQIWLQSEQAKNNSKQRKSEEERNKPETKVEITGESQEYQHHGSPEDKHTHECPREQEGDM